VVLPQESQKQTGRRQRPATPQDKTHKPLKYLSPGDKIFTSSENCGRRTGSSAAVTVRLCDEGHKNDGKIKQISNKNIYEKLFKLKLERIKTRCQGFPAVNDHLTRSSAVKKKIITQHNLLYDGWLEIFHTPK